MTPGVVVASPNLCFDARRALDRELARVARKSGPLRLAIGTGLEKLESTGGHHELGFPSLQAYAAERCGWSATWTRQARWLARRAHRLPALRTALIAGKISWSMALEVARVAAPDTIEDWLQISARCTIGKFRALVKQTQGDDSAEPQEPEPCLLTITCTQEESWLLECARLLFRRMDGGTDGDFVQALVSEATSTLQNMLPEDRTDPMDLVPAYAMQRKWTQQLARWRQEAEALTDERVLAHKDDGLKERSLFSDTEVASLFDFTGTAEAIDVRLRQLCRELVQRDVLIGELAERFWKADGWRHLGYATENQYARERLGLCITSVNDKRKLARELSRLPHLKEALHAGLIEYEAARLIAAVASPETDAAWATRAAVRTLVHLEEDIDAAKLLAKAGRRERVEPPDDAVVTELRALKAEVITGAVFRDTPAPANDGDQKCAPPVAGHPDVNAVRNAIRGALGPHPRRNQGAGEVLRFLVEPEIRALYRGTETLYLRNRKLPFGFLQFACRVFIETWVRELPPIAYAHIYARDGFKCTNPVCPLHQGTPHHTRFRSQGGTDEPDNVITLCPWCHLQGVHENRISVTGKAPHDLTWRIGTHTTVIGRTRIRAA